MKQETQIAEENIHKITELKFNLKMKRVTTTPTAQFDYHIKIAEAEAKQHKSSCQRGLEFLKKLDKSEPKKQDEDLKQILHNLNWIDILSLSINRRKTSWGENPVFEWRNASDEVCMSVINALEDKNVLSKIFGDVIVLEKITDLKQAIKLYEDAGII